MAGPTNEEVAHALDDWAYNLEEQGANTYRSRAYHRAAATVAALERPVRDLSDLKAIPNVGSGIAASIRKYLDGTWPELEEARARRRSLLAGPLTPDDAVPPDPGAPSSSSLHAAEAPTAAARSILAALQGDLHAHTRATDGRNTIEEMASAAARRGYRFFAITDHSKETRIAGGLDEPRMRIHIARIRRIAQQFEDEGLRLLAGAEVDILRDGRLDFPDDLLEELDVVLCSLHFRHRLDADAQTERILHAMSNDHADILAHPTARRRGIRPGIELDMERITDAARDQGWAIEMNGAPERRDLHAQHAAMAASKGVPLSIDSDAHSVGELANVRHAAAEAGMAGLSPGHILNARPWDEVQRLLG